MKSISTFAAGALLAGQTLAHPVAKRQDNIDTTVLQFALTLEHLENTFYKLALNTLSQQQFVDAGYEADYYTNLQYIANDEQVHVDAISAALEEAGVMPNQPCEYNFPFSDVPSFITLSSVLEGVGTSAYLGAADLITSKEYLTVAGSILAVEALHTSFQRHARGLVPQANPFYTPLDPNPVFTLAAAFIVSCPAENMPLPFMAFPALTAADAGPLAMGQDATFTTESHLMGHQYLTFVSGLAVESIMVEPMDNSVMAPVPMSVEGQSYVFITNANCTGGPLTDSVIVAGPAIIEVTPDAPVY